MKKIFIFVLLMMITVFINAQNNTQVGDQDPALIGIESAQQELQEVSVDRFEHEGFWRSSMSSDEGYTTTRLIPSKGPKNKQPIEKEKESGIEVPDIHVLGTRVDFLRRGYDTFTIYPTRPIPIEGITKTVSVWVAGRNFNHTMKLLIQDYTGKNFELTFDKKLNFVGWEKLTAVIRPETDLGGIVQASRHSFNKMGIKIMGFRIECDPWEAYGSYYIYLDDLRAVTDLFAENNRDEDDINDGW